MSADSTKKPRRLGRGLSALIQDAAQVEVELKQNQAKGTGYSYLESPGLTHVLLDDIVPNPSQPRETFDETELEQLAQSIRQAGVI